MMFRPQENISFHSKRDGPSRQEKAEKVRCSSGDAPSCVILTVTLWMRQSYGQSKKVSSCQESWVRDEEVEYWGYFKIFILIMCVCVCISCGYVHVCTGALLCAGAHWGQRHGIPLDLDFHQSWATLWVVRTELWSYWRAVSTQNLWAILPAPHWRIFKDSIWGRNCDYITIHCHTRRLQSTRVDTAGSCGFRKIIGLSFSEHTAHVGMLGAVFA